MRRDHKTAVAYFDQAIRAVQERRDKAAEGLALRLWQPRGEPERRRLGKEAGHSDIEVALLREAGLITLSTVLVTPVHPLQVLNEPLPETDHDFSVDLIIRISAV